MNKMTIYSQKHLFDVDSTSKLGRRERCKGCGTRRQHLRTAVNTARALTDRNVGALSSKLFEQSKAYAIPFNIG